jgi:hypothetical protein
VLRCNWTAQTVRITRIPGTDAASPSAPDVETTSGTLLDVTLYQALVTTAGVVTLAVDERVYATPAVDNVTIETALGALRLRDIGITTAKLADGSVTNSKLAADAVTTPKILDGVVNTNKLADSAVTNAKLANDAVTTLKILDGVVNTNKLANGSVTNAKLANDAVDDTKVGARVPAITRRQGGHPTDWSVPGTTNYTPAAVRMQAGMVRINTLSADPYADVVVTFPVAFSAPPLVLATPSYSDGGLNSGKLYASVDSIAANQVHIYLHRVDGAFSTGFADLFWMAIGPE